jgi:hypothetical protein
VIGQWTTDLRHAWRALLRAPGFLVTAIGTLALAIGAVAGMFGVVNTVILRPLPFPASDRLVVVSGTAPESDLPGTFGLGMDFYFHYSERSKLIDGMFVFSGGTSTLRRRTASSASRWHGRRTACIRRLACARNSGGCRCGRMPTASC